MRLSGVKAFLVPMLAVFFLFGCGKEKSVDVVGDGHEYVDLGRDRDQRHLRLETVQIRHFVHRCLQIDEILQQSDVWMQRLCRQSDGVGVCISIMRTVMCAPHTSGAGDRWLGL